MVPIRQVLVGEHLLGLVSVDNSTSMVRDANPSRAPSRTESLRCSTPGIDEEAFAVGSSAGSPRNRTSFNEPKTQGKCCCCAKPFGSLEMLGCIEVHGPCTPRKLNQAGAGRVQLEESVEAPRCLVDILGPQHVDDSSGRVADLWEVVVGGVEDSLRCAVIYKKRSEAVGVEIRFCGRQIGEVDDETQSTRVRADFAWNRRHGVSPTPDNSLALTHCNVNDQSLTLLVFEDAWIGEV